MQYVDVAYAPDIDTAWSRNPGTLTEINAFAPLQSGHYGSVGTIGLGFSITGSDHLIAQTFRQVNGSVRLLTFRQQNIDEYDSSGTRTNRGTGYSSSTTMWSSVAWGNQIIATNYYDSPQSSTGAGFSALSGSPPKARMVAANINFVMFADVDDGGSNVYSDMVWWSGIRNPTTWTPAQATQAGNIRLLDVPGPIRALVAFGNRFVAFKDNAILVGDYIGVPYVFRWQVVSARIGCVGQNAVCELDGKLYFAHTSGFYEFDGQNIRPIGLGVNQTFLFESGYLTFSGIADPTYTARGISYTQAVADDIEGVVWFTANNTTSGGAETFVIFGYNARSGKWGRHAVVAAATAATSSPLIKATTSDIQAFWATAGVGNRNVRMWAIWNDGAGTTIRAILYPYITTDSAPSSFTTGFWGESDSAGQNSQIYLRHVSPTTTTLATGDVTGTALGQPRESGGTTITTPTTYNTELAALQHTMNARYRRISASYAVGSRVRLGGIALSEKASGKR